LFFLFVDLADGTAKSVDVIGITGVEALENLKAGIVFFEVDFFGVEGGLLFGSGGFSGSGGLLI
jgi:hypothetical protein